MGKRKVNKIVKGKELTEEQRLMAKEAKIDRLEKLQTRREEQRYVRLLKSAENRLKLAQEAKARALIRLEEAKKGLSEAEAYLDKTAKEVMEWETHGVMWEKTFTEVEVGDKVAVVHRNELGVMKAEEGVEPILGTALTSGKPNGMVKVQKLNFEAVKTAEVVDKEEDPLDAILTAEAEAECKASVEV